MGYRGKPSVPETEILLVLFFSSEGFAAGNGAECSASESGLRFSGGIAAIHCDGRCNRWSFGGVRFASEGSKWNKHL